MKEIKKIKERIAYVLNDFEKIRSSLSNTEQVLLDKFPEIVYKCLEKNYQILDYIYFNIKQKGGNLIQNHMIKLDESLKEKYPSSNCHKINSFIKEKNLPQDFYPSFQVNYELYHILEKKKIFYLLKKYMILI